MELSFCLICSICNRMPDSYCMLNKLIDSSTFPYILFSKTTLGYYPKDTCFPVVSILWPHDLSYYTYTHCKLRVDSFPPGNCFFYINWLHLQSLGWCYKPCGICVLMNNWKRKIPPLHLTMNFEDSCHLYCITHWSTLPNQLFPPWCPPDSRYKHLLNKYSLHRRDLLSKCIFVLYLHIKQAHADSHINFSQWEK